MRELNIGAFAERSDGFVLLSHEVADCPASPWACGVGALAGQIGHLLASCGPEDFDSHPCLHPRFCLGEWDRGVWLLCCLWPL